VLGLQLRLRLGLVLGLGLALRLKLRLRLGLGLGLKLELRLRLRWKLAQMRPRASLERDNELTLEKEEIVLLPLNQRYPKLLSHEEMLLIFLLRSIVIFFTRNSQVAVQDNSRMLRNLRRHNRRLCSPHCTNWYILRWCRYYTLH